MYEMNHGINVTDSRALKWYDTHEKGDETHTKITQSFTFLGSFGKHVNKAISEIKLSERLIYNIHKYLLTGVTEQIRYYI